MHKAGWRQAGKQTAVPTFADHTCNEQSDDEFRIRDFNEGRAFIVSFIVKLTAIQ